MNPLAWLLGHPDHVAAACLVLAAVICLEAVFYMWLVLTAKDLDR